MALGPRALLPLATALPLSGYAGSPSFPRLPEPRVRVPTEKMLRTTQPCCLNNELLVVDPPLCWALTWDPPSFKHGSSPSLKPPISP